jgi:hypothetical protein
VTPSSFIEKTETFAPSLLLCILLLGINTFGEFVSFTKITSGDLVTDGGDSRGVAWGDYNGDGFEDLFVANRSVEQNRLYLNNRDGTFTKITNTPITAEFSEFVSGSWADYDNDGRLDLFVTSVTENTPNSLFRNQGGGRFSKITNAPISLDATRSVVGIWADFDRDGFVDLFVGNNGGLQTRFTQENYLYRNKGDGTFEKLGNGIVVNDLGRFLAAGWVDYDNDGDSDLFVTDQEANLPNRLYRNNADGTFTKVTSGSVVTDLAPSWGVAWGDYNNDGFLDLFVANMSGSSNFLYANNRDGSFTKVLNEVVVSERANAQGCVWADFDNDGDIDLFVANGNNGVNFMYENENGISFKRATAGQVVTDRESSTGAAAADYNNDGFYDIFVANGSGQNNSLYRNNGNSNNWLKVRCIGTFSNRSSIGTKVRALATINGNSVWQMREISGGASRASQDSLIVGFGLGGATNAETLRVEWPSGSVQEIRRVTANQTLVVTEPPRLRIFTLTQGRFSFAIENIRELNYRIETSSNLFDWNFKTRVLRLDGIVEIGNTAESRDGRLFYRAVQE